MTQRVIQPALEFAFAQRVLSHVRISWQAFTLAGILLCAFGLRVAGVDSGLPLVFNLDEVTVVEHSLSLSWNDLNPHAFMYGSLPFYMLKVVTSIAGFVVPTLTLANYYLLDRFISVVLGTANVYLAFVLGRLIRDRTVGLLSAAIFAISPLAIGVSHYATVDSMMGFWCAVSLIGMVFWLKGNERAVVFTAIAAGLAIATKYNAAMLLVPILLIALELELAKPTRMLASFGKKNIAAIVLISAIVFAGLVLGRDYILNLVAHWSTRGQLQPIYIQIFNGMLVAIFIALVLGVVLTLGIVKNWGWAIRIGQFLTSPLLLTPVLLIGLTFLLASPFVLLDLPSFLRDFFFQVNKNISGGIVGYAPGSRSYLAVLNEESSAFNSLQYVQAIEGEWGILVFAALLVGLWALWRQDRKVFIPFGILVLLIIVGTMTWRYQATRYLFPLWTLLAVLGGLGIAHISRMLISWIKNPWLSRAAIGGLLILTFQAPAGVSLDQVRYGFLTLDTRNLALAWVEKNVQPGTVILREWGTPEIERASLHYRVQYTGFPFEEVALAEWKARGVAIVMVSSERYDFYRAHSADFRDVLTEYDRLRQTRLLQTFEPGPGIKGPPVYIYSLD